jgi:hypothetical protein
MNGCKKVSVYYGFIQRTGHAILFVDEGTISINKSASSNFDIARVLEHRWIQRRVEGFRGSGSDVALLCSSSSCCVQNTIMAVCVH